MQKLQSKAARIVCKAPDRANLSELLKSLSWLSVNQQISYQTLLLIYKIRQKKEPEYLYKILSNDSYSFQPWETEAFASEVLMNGIKCHCQSETFRTERTLNVNWKVGS